MQTRFLMPLLGTALCATLIPTPVAAQTGQEKVSQVIVYGNDQCKPSEDPNEIVVCARLPESERYRIPEMFRNDPEKPANQSWTQRAVALERAGRFGIDSCSPVGMGGFTGCSQELIRNAYAEKRAKDKLDWEKMTADARAERMKKLDAEAALVEARVREAEARKKAQQTQGEPAQPKPQPATPSKP